MKRILLLYTIPVIWFIGGLLYARTLDAFVGIGVMLLVIVSSVALLGGVISFHITRRILFSMFVGVISVVVLYGALILSVR